MSEKQSFISQVNERLGSPLFFSFIVSWLFWNWEIVIGLVWYNADNIEKYGFKSYRTLIDSYANAWYNYVIPMGFALLYTFGWPFVRNKIDEFLAKKKKENELAIREIDKGRYVPIEMLVELQKYNDETQSTIISLSENIKKNNEESGKYLKMYNDEHEKYKKAFARISEWIDLNDLDFLKGSWQLTYSERTDPNETGTFTPIEEITVGIDKNRITVTTWHTYEIRFGAYNLTEGIFFVYLDKVNYANIPQEAQRSHFDLTGFYVFKPNSERTSMSSERTNGNKMITLIKQ
ncbi:MULTISPECIES: hypothetical protein [Olivibacter]|uniref:SMODS-associating 2TM beta-strand rich effector domain-containing protein n=1 Tax=Olivibacter jilunii TaxID=985016 RepID=A0ABW6AYR0_9SPHI